MNIRARITALVCLLCSVLAIVIASITLTPTTQAATGTATSFVFTNSGITVTEGDYTGYKISGTDLTINGSGSYTVSGTCTDGTITVKKATTDVTLTLNGLNLTSSDTAPICCNKSTQVNIIAAAGTTNTLTDAALNNDETYPDQEDIAENAVIKTKDGSQITIGGTGTLNIVSNGKNGIKGGATTDDEGEASLTIKNLNLNITASVNDAINSESTLNVESGTLKISAADDAIHSDYVLNIGETGTTGPTITISSCYEGLEGATFTMDSGNVNITASDDAINAANSDLTGYSFSLTINGGTIYANADGDGFDSNGTLTINGGNVTIYAAEEADNSPLDADGTISINGGTVLGVGRSGMTETIGGTQKTIIFGKTNEQQGGNQQGGQGGMQPGDQGGTQPSDQGTTPPSIPGTQVSDTQSTLTTQATDTTQPAAGSTPPDSSTQPGGQAPLGTPGEQGGTQPGGQGGTQPSEQNNGAISLEANTEFSIVDGDGNVLTTGKTVRATDYIVYSSSELADGVAYNLVVNGSNVASTTTDGSQPNNQANSNETNNTDSTTDATTDATANTNTTTNSANNNTQTIPATGDNTELIILIAIVITISGTCAVAWKRRA